MTGSHFVQKFMPTVRKKAPCILQRRRRPQQRILRRANLVPTLRSLDIEIGSSDDSAVSSLTYGLTAGAAVVGDHLGNPGVGTCKSEPASARSINPGMPMSTLPGILLSAGYMWSATASAKAASVGIRNT